MKKELEINESLSEERIKNYEKAYNKNKTNIVVKNALSRGPISSIVNANEALLPLQMNFNVEVKTMEVCDQENSGRCWIFAGLNVLREEIAKKLNVKSFELSQNYIAFFDKLEKTNYALCSIIDLLDEKPDDRVLMHILSNAISDGGQWDMLTSLINKYGLCPKYVMNETFASGHTQECNQLINFNIRIFASEAKKLHEAKEDEKISALKDKFMDKVYSLLCNCFGVPPKKFEFEYTNADGKYFVKKYTPMSFFTTYIGETLNEYVSIINSPTKDKPFNKTYTISYLGNVVEGKKIQHLNVSMDRLKELVVAQLSAGSPVWFGSDVSFYRNRTTYVWDTDSLNYEAAFGFDTMEEKSTLLDYHASVMNHAMVITGVNLVKNKPTKWKIENSWGTNLGKAGYFIMSAKWFDSFTYQAVIKKEFLNEIERAALNEESTVLAPWDPMGTLAD